MNTVADVVARMERLVGPVPAIFTDFFETQPQDQLDWLMDADDERFRSALLGMADTLLDLVAAEMIRRAKEIIGRGLDS